jgi:hypothetical protein
MSESKSTGATAPSAAVERRLFQYPGSSGLVWRYFIVGDHTPMAYRTEQEAVAEILRRLGERRRP